MLHVITLGAKVSNKEREKKGESINQTNKVSVTGLTTACHQV